VAFFAGGAAGAAVALQVYWPGLTSDGSTMSFYGLSGGLIWIVALVEAILAIMISWITARVSRRA
jgi:hypothetical protein